jgi:hypothetical protein
MENIATDEKLINIKYYIMGITQMLSIRLKYFPPAYTIHRGFLLIKSI